MIAVMTGRKTTIRFTPAALRVVREWVSRGCDVQTIVNCGVMAWVQTDAVGREKAQLAAFAEGNTKTAEITDPSDSALGEQLIRDAAARSGLPAETRENSGGGGQRSRREPGRKAG